MENRNRLKRFLGLSGLLIFLFYLVLLYVGDISKFDTSWDHDSLSLIFGCAFYFAVAVFGAIKFTTWHYANFYSFGIYQFFDNSQVKKGYWTFAAFAAFPLLIAGKLVKFPILIDVAVCPLPFYVISLIALKTYDNNATQPRVKIKLDTPSEHKEPIETVKTNNQNIQKPISIDKIFPKTVIPTGDITELNINSAKGFGSAHWISDNKKNELTDVIKLDDNKVKGVGLWIGGGYFNHKEGNLCSFALPGTGKGAALIIPNLLWERSYKHSFVVFDPKGTNACITAKFQQSQGQRVIILDPMQVQKEIGATHRIAPACFNPLDEIVGDIYNGSALFVNLMLPDDPHADSFWNQKAREFMKAVLMHVMTADKYENERNFITFYKLIKRANYKELLYEMAENFEINDEISHAALEFASILVNSDRTFFSILGSVTNAISWIGNPLIQTVIKKSDFTTEEFSKGGISLYLCQPVDHKDQFASFSRLVVGSILRKNVKPAKQKKEWVYYLLDEFPSMGIFPEVVDMLALAREYKMRIWLFSQSISHLDTLYKVEGRNRILGNIGIMQAFGVPDNITQEYITKRVGQTTQAEHQNSVVISDIKSYSYGSTSDDSGGHSNNTENKTYNTTQTSNHSMHGRDLIMPNEVEHDPNIITIITGVGAMRLSRWLYWKYDEEEIAKMYYEIMNDGRADKNPNYTEA